MDAEKLRRLLAEVREGTLGVDGALSRLKTLPFEDIPGARLDLHRDLRQGLPEVVFAEGKSADQVIAILEKLWEHHDRVLATRVSDEMAVAIRGRLPEARHDPVSRLLTLAKAELPRPSDDAPYGLVVSGGTSDLAVAEEVAQTLEFCGSRVERAYDVGVAGVHRLLSHGDRLFKADVVVSVAGMEGALTSVVGGLVACPVVGVPTSVGYGASFGGLAALLAMLNSCAPGVAVVNIDNGFGGGVHAHFILRRLREARS